MNIVLTNAKKHGHTQRMLKSFLLLSVTCLILLAGSSIVSADVEITWTDTPGAENMSIVASCPAAYISNNTKIEYEYAYRSASGGGKDLACGRTKTFSTSGAIFTASVIAKPLNGLIPCSVDYSRRGDTIVFTMNYDVVCPLPTQTPTSARVVPDLPTDETGAYYMDGWEKVYAWFMSRAICDSYMGSEWCDNNPTKYINK